MIDISKPTVTINLAEFTAPRDVITRMRLFNFGPYAYIFNHLKIPMKIGESANRGTTPGDRLYRQAGHIFGWETPLISGAGMDMKEVVSAFEKAYGLTVHKDNVTIAVYDAEPLIRYYGDSASKYAETQLMNQYQKLHNNLPIGNFKDTRLFGHCTMFTALFDIEN